MRLAVCAALQPTIVRSGALTPVGAAGALSVGAVLVTRSVWASDDAVDWALRLAVMMLAASVGFALDDPTEPTVGSAPMTLLARRVSRLVPAAAIAALSWGVSVAASGGAAAAALTLMLTGLAVAGVSVTALAAPRAPRRAGAAGAGVVLATALVITRLPDRWTMLPDPTAGLNEAAKLRWATLIVIGLAVLIYASRDPGRARRPRHPSRRQLGIRATDGS